MARPRKSRRVCHFPQSLSFSPMSDSGKGEPVYLTVDEYETLRLIDLEGYSQETCGAWMGVARTTVQQIYASARSKLARMLVESRPLEITGGDFRLCDGTPDCGLHSCYKQQYYKNYEKPNQNASMRIAVPFEDGAVFQDFANTRQFMIYDVLDGRIHSAESVAAKGAGYGALAGVLTALRTDMLICGEIGREARAALHAAGIEVENGISGDADAAVLSKMTAK